MIFSQLKKLFQMVGKDKNSTKKENSSRPGENDACRKDCIQKSFWSLLDL